MHRSLFLAALSCCAGRCNNCKKRRSLLEAPVERAQVPDAAVIVAEAGPLSKALGKALKRLDKCKEPCEYVLEAQPLVVTLMYERMLGVESNWAPYLGFLPEAFPHMPMMWTVRALCSAL